MTQDHSHEQTQSLADPLGPKTGDQRRAAAERAGARPEQIGPYKILETLGEGGMGIVYLAEQVRPIHRRVALKIIKAGMDTRQVIARFETEREALALMNHPNVAKVLEAGATETGRPYFVMEYVPGIPITEYCDKHRLNTEERLRLFIDVCHAIQHAHQKGIIHRDIKPSNVLVSVATEPRSHEATKGRLEGTKGKGASVPVVASAEIKVIDFGVAKATQHRLTEMTLFTEQGQLIGTPGYMSPEQAEMTALNIDTRTDIYSLGVLLYELLVGSRPFDEQMLREAGFAEIQRIIREVDPPKPSTKLSSLGDDSTTIAQMRHTEPRSLARQLKGDLDWITMKCLEKDRTRRYAAASDLAGDVTRHLSHEPVLAGPPRPGYRLRKFIRRNRGVVIAATLLALTLLLGISATTGAMVWALRERSGAEHEANKAQLAESEQARERKQAEEARDEAEAVTRFMIDMLATAKPENRGRETTIREVLDQAARTLGERFFDRVLIEARIRDALGWIYLSLGLVDEADRQASMAARIHYRELGPSHQVTLRSTMLLGAVLAEQGSFNRAAVSHEQLLAIQNRVLGEEHQNTMATKSNLATVLLRRGQYGDAEKKFREVLEIQKRILGEEHRDTLASTANLAMALRRLGRLAEAEAMYRELLTAHGRNLGSSHPITLMSLGNLCNVLAEQKRYAEAEDILRKIVETARQVLGEEHPDTLILMNNLANVLDAQGKPIEAEELHRTILGRRKRILGDDHLHTLGSRHNLAWSLHKQGKLVEAEQLYRATLESKRRVLGDGHPEYLRGISALGSLLVDLGRFAEVEPLFMEVYESSKDSKDVPLSRRRAIAEAFIRLYDAWDAREPGKGYAQKAEEWRAKMEQLEGSQATRQPGNEAKPEPRPLGSGIESEPRP